MLKVFIAALLYGLLFGSVELVTKHFKINKENSRKVVHIAAGVSAACLPLFMTFDEVIWLSLLFVPIMLVSKRRNIFSSIHQVKRLTYGEVYFPLAIFLTALLFPHKAIYVYGLLVMALSDGFASVVGQRYGKQKYIIGRSQKSYIGSATFFLISVLVGLCVLAALGANHWQAGLIGTGCALVLTLVEGVLPFGTDNLVLPPLASFLIWSAVRVFSLS